MSLHQPLSPASQFTFYPRGDYFQHLAQSIAQTKKGDRVALATMAFESSTPGIQRVLDEAHAAAKRGVTVHLMVDAFSFLVRNRIMPGPLMAARTLPNTLTKTFQKRLDALAKLQANGGHYTITNQPGRALTMPFAGRSHIKFAVVNNDVYIGGCNLASDSHIDLMAQWTDPKIADWLCAFARRVAESGQVREAMNDKDIELPVDATTRLLVDAGVANQSLIFNEALRLIDTAEKHIFLTCQYFPNDITIRKLEAASARGVDVTIVYNPPGKHTFPFNLLHHGVVLSEKTKRAPHFFAHQLSKKHNYIHAKLLSTDKGTMIGSHNYVRAGVAFGTAEIALFSTDKPFGDKAVATLKSML